MAGDSYVLLNSVTLNSLSWECAKEAVLMPTWWKDPKLYLT